MATETLTTLTINELSRAKFESLASNEQLEVNQLYMITDDGIELIYRGAVLSSVPYYKNNVVFDDDVYYICTDACICNQETNENMPGSDITHWKKLCHQNGAPINDSASTTETVWSSSKIYDLLYPHVVYGSDDYTTGVLAHNEKVDDLTDSSFQITGVDLTPYKRIKCYIAANSDKASKARTTPPMVVEIYLEEGQKFRGPAITNNFYIGQAVGYCTEDRNVLYRLCVAVNPDKTKVCFVDQSTLYGTTIGGRNDNARYLYKIEGYKI